MPANREGAASLDGELSSIARWQWTGSGMLAWHRFIAPVLEDTMQPVNLSDKLSAFADLWQPRTVGQFNGHDLMVVKVKGEFVWHEHADSDDFFLVLKGRITIQRKEGDVTLGPGELFVVPRGVQHCPRAEDEAHLLLIEPTGTPNTGNAVTAAERRVI
jgi:mannose-6-phosphate isomerase-like protein (cupin superfamily)